MNTTDFYSLTLPQIFAVLGLLLCIAEVFLPGFWVLPVGVGFLLTAISGLFGVQGNLLWVALVLSLLSSVVFTVKFLRPHLKKGAYQSNMFGLIGLEVLVEERIDVSANTGSVRIYSDHWRALTLNDEVLEKGSRVRVHSVDGNKLYVTKVS